MKCIFFVYITGTLLLGTAFMTYAQSSAVKAVVGFEKQIVNASEGNVAVVCVTSLFISSTLSTPVTVNVSLMNFSSQSSAADMDDFDISAISVLSVSPVNKTQCLRISIIEDNTQEGLENFGLELEPIDPTVFIFRHNLTVNILEMCYNGELRLQDGFDEYQGRVEVCYGGVWGTVCHNNWDKTDAQVVCRQLGLLNRAEAFSNAIFGPASYDLPVYLDRVECNGVETQLVHCWHHDDTGTCLHSKDASVDCLGRSIVGAPCATEGNVRLTGGQDEYQGRVEVCTDGIYSSICHNRWDDRDAQVVCRQLNLSDSTGGAGGTTGSVFRMGAGSIVLTDINCLGNESSILNCSLSTIVDPNKGCSHFNEAGVDCLGREIRGATVSFEQLHQDNGQPLAIREGQSLQICVVVTSGILPYEELFTILQNPLSTNLCPLQRDKRGISLEASSSLDLDDYVIEYPIQQRQQIYLGPSLNQSCINITAIDDEYLEDKEEYLTLYLINGGKSNAKVTNSVIQVVILDNDMNCRNGGSVCVDTKTLTTRCIPQQYVCDGINNCTDGSDESNCPDYCSISKMDGFNCLSEKLCIPQDYVCDGIPDCVRGRTIFDEINCIPTLVNCTHGDIREPLLGGVADNEGLVEVCVDGAYYPVSLDNGQFSVREATAICKQLSLGNVGMPLSALSSFGFQVQSYSRIAKIRCDKESFDNSTDISSCEISLPPVIDQRQSGVRCFQSDPCQDGEVRLVNDAFHNNEEEQMSEGSANFLVDSNMSMANAPAEGRIEICFRNVWGAIFDRNFTNKDAAVVCHQLGYDRYGAIPTPFIYYGKTENVPFVLSSPVCNGYETSLLQCANDSTLPFGEANQYHDQPDHERNTAGVICEQYETATSNCSYLDVRLTFRTASSSGLVEICNKEGIWSIATSNMLNTSEKTVICRQLGFMNFPDSTSFAERISLHLSDQREKFDEFLHCSGDETSLDQCVPLTNLRKRRGLTDVETNLSNFQLGLRCGAPLMIHFQPPSPDGIYTVEQHRKLNLSCFWGQNIYPPPNLFTNFTETSYGNGPDIPLNKIINFFQTSDAMLSDGGTFACIACNSIAQIRTENSVAITVRVPEGLNESAYIRVSHISVERAISPSSIRVRSFTFRAKQVQNQILSSISTNFPGLHIVDNCTNVNRRQLETERRLNRLECVVTQYREQGEEVLPVLQVLQKAAAILERQLSPVLILGVNISVTGFCNREIVFGKGTKFDWPETIGGANATFLCPNNATVLRCCRNGGIWQEFDHGGCTTDVGFERLYQDNGNPLAIREGHSLQVCVVAFGNLPFQEIFTVEPYYFDQEIARRKRGATVPDISQSFQFIAASDSDYVIEYPFRGNEILLGPDMPRSCINITANDDTEEESPSESLVLRLHHYNKEISSVQVIHNRNTLTINLLDDDIDCKDDERVCVETEILSVRCTKSNHICDGINDCKDGSDELDCSDYCSVSQIDGFNCLSEKFCVPQEHLCDGFPDCVRATTVFDEMNCIPTPDGCNDGDALLGGASKAEGIVEVCFNGTYLPVSLDNGRFSVREATAICNQLNLGNAGIPLNVAASFGFHVSVSVSHMAKLRCNDTFEDNTNVSACTLSLSTLDRRPAGIRCFQTEPCEDGEVQLVSDNLIDFDQDQNGSNGDVHNTEDKVKTEGRVEICFNNVWGAIYDENWSYKDAAVVCHQLGFSRSRAIPKPFTYYGETDNVPFVLSDPVCQGTEDSIFQCQNHSTLRFGEANRYHGEPEYMLNMIGVQCEQNELERCSYLDVRLTFRSTVSSGLVEICNEDGQWSIACSDAINAKMAIVICQQLDFSSENFLTESIPLYNTDQRPVIYDLSACEGTETSLGQCQLFNTDRNKRELASDTCEFQAKVQCAVPPAIYFHPPSPSRLYTVEQQRRLSLSCFWDQNIYPPVVLFTDSTGGAEFNDEFEEQGVQTFINFLQETEAKPADSGDYSCIADNTEGTQTENSLTIRVLEPEGNGDSAFIRASYPSTGRASYIESHSFVLTIEKIRVQILSSISEKLPGLHIVDNCSNVNRRQLEIDRRLDRVECRVTQYKIQDRAVFPVAIVVQQAAALLERWSTHIVGINVSATGFCSREVVIEDFTTFDWPETLGGTNASFLCQNNNSVTRMCGVGGVWKEFDREGCNTGT